MAHDDSSMNVVTRTGFECEEGKVKKVWRLKVQLHGFHVVPHQLVEDYAHLFARDNISF